VDMPRVPRDEVEQAIPHASNREACNKTIAITISTHMHVVVQAVRPSTKKNCLHTCVRARARIPLLLTF